MWTDLPAAVTEALERLHARGFSAFLVGGCVRDLLRGVKPHDYDLTTSATPQEIKAAFSDKNVVETGIRHGTVTVFSRHMPLEITTFRKDGTYSDGRHPDGVSFATDIKEDLSRRDFTVNAMAWSPKDGLVDLFGGREDLQNGVIRCVGEPVIRFREDALRILRGLRFSSQLCFAIEKQTATAMRECTPLLEQVSRERIADEFIRLLCGPGVEAVLTEYRHIIAFFVPELQAGQNGEFPGAKLVSAVPPVPLLRLSAFFYGRVDVAVAETVLKRLRTEKKLIRGVTCLLRESASFPWAMDDPTALRLLQRVPADLVQPLLDLMGGIASAEADPSISMQSIEEWAGQIHRLLASSPCLSVADLAVTGDDLLQMGCPAGESIGKILRTLLENVTDGKIPNQPEALKANVKKLLESSAHTVLEND